MKFYLYHHSNHGGQEVQSNDASSHSAADFNRSWPTRITIHGWNSNLNAGVNVNVRNALLNNGNYNVFTVDGSVDAQTVYYPSARYNVSSVGVVFSNFVDFLNGKGMYFYIIDVIGYSVDALVAGFTGKKVSRGRVHIIRGLDLALLLSTMNVRHAFATYLESIQTDYWW